MTLEERLKKAKELAKQGKLQTKTSQTGDPLNTAIVPENKQVQQTQPQQTGGIAESQFTPQSESYRGQAVSKDQQALNLIKRGDLNQVSQMGGLSSTVRSTLQGAKAQEQQKTEFQRKIEDAKIKNKQKEAVQQKAIESAGVGIQRGTEAPNIALAQGQQGLLGQKAQLVAEESQAVQQQLTEKQVELDDALKKGRADLVQQARSSILDLQKQELNLKTQATQGVLDTLGSTLTGKSEDELAQIALDQGVDLGMLKMQQEKLQMANKTEEAKLNIAQTQARDKQLTDMLKGGLLFGAKVEDLTNLANGSSFSAGDLAFLAQSQKEMMEMKEDDPLLSEKKRKYNAEIAGLKAKTAASEVKSRSNIAFSFIEDNKTVGELQSLPEGTADTGLPRQGSEEARGECGAFVNDYLGANVVQDSYASKIDPDNWAKVGMEEMNKPYPGSVFVYQGKNPNDANYGHIGFITGVNKDGTYEVTDSNSDGKRVTEHRSDVDLSQMKGLKFFGKSKLKDIDLDKITDAQINRFNKGKPNKGEEELYDAYVNGIAKLQQSGETDALTLMKFSRGQKPLTTSDNKIYKDIGTVVNQLGAMNDKIEKYREETWFSDDFAPIEGLIANANPWNTNAQGIKAQLTALVPKLARGVFGEVGVLTDQDIANYIKTLPNIKQTADVNDVVQLALLGTLQASLDNAISTDQATYDISGLESKYRKLKDQTDALKEKIEDKKTPQQVQSSSSIDDLDTQYFTQKSTDIWNNLP